MKTLSVFLLSAFFAVAAHAGSVDGKSHEGKMGGCASKNKMAGVHHFDKKHGNVAHSKIIKENTQQMDAATEKKQLIEQSI